MTRCAECSAEYQGDDSCAGRFARLLALDHSREEPWGSRHGQAFAAFALQHPERHAASLDHAWAVLYRIYVAAAPPADTFRAVIDRRGAIPDEWGTPPRPTRRRHDPAVTIADLGDFAAAGYPAALDAWCRAGLASWGAGPLPVEDA
ncbi:MAG: DUF5946 family protein [Gemmatimonadales bacterium]